MPSIQAYYLIVKGGRLTRTVQLVSAATPLAETPADAVDTLKRGYAVYWSSQNSAGLDDIEKAFAPAH